jgi:carbamate kinase
MKHDPGVRPLEHPAQAALDLRVVLDDEDSGGGYRRVIMVPEPNR